MLNRLRIKNIGLINELAVEFGSGLNILTGETGAGKSMIVSALNLVLGERADSDLVKSGEKSAMVEAVFDEKWIKPAARILEKQGIDAEEGEFIIRRLLRTEGKSRALVNGSAINLSALKLAGETMVDIHGQHDHQALLRKETHLPWLDSYLGLDGEREQVAVRLLEIRKLDAALNELIKKQKEARAQKEFMEYKLEELEKADLKDDEESRLENEQRRLASAEKIRMTGQEIFEKVYDSDESLLAKLEQAAREMKNLISADHFFEKYSNLFSETSAQLSDAALEIQSYCSSVEDDPAKLREVEERQALIEKLKRKHKEDLPGLIKMVEDTRRELDSMENADAQRDELESKLTKATEELEKKAAALHKKRAKGIAAFKKDVQKEMTELNMPAARFEIEVLLAPDDKSGFELDGVRRKMFPHGFGEYQFLFSANEGQPAKPLVKIASGGEISRVMLALKSATGRPQPVPVVLFDEVDSGIGGKSADMVGEKLKKLAKNCQIICITHLPQIARQADRHFVVEKKVLNGHTAISIRRLNDDGRVEELARMGAGKIITEAARRHAKELIAR